MNDQSIADLAPIEDLLGDPEIREIFVDAYDRICVDRAGTLVDVPNAFASPQALLSCIRALIEPYGAQLDQAHPSVDVRLSDRSRLTAVIPPLSPDGPTLVLRKFFDNGLTLADLLRFGAMTPTMATFLEACVVGGATILVSGGTGSGKTTLLNCLCQLIPVDERVIVVERELEIMIQRRRLLRLEAAEGVSVSRLFVQALKMRPERIIAGEMLGGEALYFLQAINIGHSGSMGSIHATSPADALARLEVMATMAEVSIPLSVLRGQIATGFDLIVQINRLPDGVRRLTQVSEVCGLERDQVQLADLFRYDRTSDTFYPTGQIPGFLDALGAKGVTVDPRIFEQPSGTGQARFDTQP